MFVDYIILFSVLLVSAMYLSLFERKIIGRIQLRYGPSYNGVFGVLQPIADTLKLLFKRNALKNHSHCAIFAICLLVCSTLMISSFIPFAKDYFLINDKFSLIYIVVFFIINSISEITIGILSKSKFGVISGIRIYLQKLSYYIPLILIVLIISKTCNSFNIIDIINDHTISIIYLPHIFIIFLLPMLMITNHVPFDFSEAESELVAGNYTEYGGILFGLIYLSEYVNLINASSLIVTIFFGISSLFYTILKIMLIITTIIIIRAILPRYRQKDAIIICWKVIVPILLAHYVILC